MTKTTMPPSKQAEQFVVRLPAGMRDRIAESAKRYNRSMNAEIVSILEDYYDLRDHHDQLVDDAAEHPLAPMTAELLSGAALERLAELLAASVAEKLSTRLPEQIPSAKPSRRPPAKRKG